jgi:hypothetical protein
MLGGIVNSLISRKWHKNDSHISATGMFWAPSLIAGFLRGSLQGSGIVLFYTQFSHIE